MDADPARGRELGLPLATERDFFGDGLEARRHADAVGEPGTDLGREGGLVGREAEVHELQVPEPLASGSA